MNINKPAANRWLNNTISRPVSPGKNSAVSTAKTNSPQQSMADAMEEIGALHSHTAEAHSKAGERGILARQPSGQHRVRHIEQLQHLFHLLHNSVPKQQRETQKQVKRALARGKTPQDAMQAILGIADQDPAVADTLLQLALYDLQQEKGEEVPSLHQAAEETRALLQQHYGERIVAGQNTAQAIAHFSQHAGQKQQMRQLYYQTVVDYQSPAHIFDTLLEKFGQKDFVPALRTLQRALADDIASLAPSAPPLALRQILHGLNMARSVSAMLHDSQTLMETLHARLPAVGVTSETLARKVLNFMHNGVYVNELNRLSQEAVGEHPLHQSRFLNGLLRLMQQQPSELWRDDKSQIDGLNLLRGLTGQFARWEKQLIQPKTL